MPTSSDLVTDLPADFEVFGQAVDTSLADLKGGTTGQVLAKASNTDMDFTWTAGGDITGVTAGTGISGGGTSGDVTITNSMATAIDAKGDLIAGTAADTFSRLAIGSNGTVLTADSAESTGMKWASPSAAGTSWSLLNTGGTALTGAATITVSGISGKDKIMVLVQNASSASASSTISCRLNTDSGTNYYLFGMSVDLASTFDPGESGGYYDNETRVLLGRMSATANSPVVGAVTFSGCNASGVKAFASTGGGRAQGSNGQSNYILQGYYNSSSTISSISVVSSTGNFDAGTVYVFTSAA